MKQSTLIFNNNISISYNATMGKEIAIKDFDGKTNTAKIIEAISKSETENTDVTAAGYCSNYSTSNYEKGKWWLPSFGELTFIMAHLRKINTALALIGEADILEVSNIYWTSNETDRLHCCGTRYIDGYYSAWRNKTDLLKVLPVTML